MPPDMKSYTAAGDLPVKLIKNVALIKQVKGGYIPPVHVQLNPTNRCNLNCGFCSCSKRDKKVEMETERIIKTMTEFKKLGCQSVTITGGGEPLLHPDINRIFEVIRNGLGIKIGLVSNGTQFDKLTNYKDLTWCRISASDDREPDWRGIIKAVETGVNVDWAFSYVLTRQPDWGKLARVVTFANQYKFTHIRIVGDLLDTEEAATQVNRASNSLYVQAVNDSCVIYQDRADYSRGRKQCLISLLKPVVGADGGIYPCCGVQYAQDPPGRDLISGMLMGGITDINRIWENQRHFDGAVCARCYYDNYNAALSLLSTDLSHEEFV